MTNSDKALEQIWIIRAQQGEIDAFESLVEKYHNRLLYYIRRMVNDEELAKDIMQTVWLRAYRNLHTLRHTEAFSVWIYRIARNFSVQQIREERKENEAYKEYKILEEDSDADDLNTLDAVLLHHALNKLQSIHKEALLLRIIEEMSYEQIAEVTACTLGTVRSRIHYAKQKLKNILENMNHE